MPKDIAVYLGDNNETASLYEKGKIVVYRKKQGHWSVLKEKECKNDEFSIADLRNWMKEAITFLDDCKIFVGYNVTGIPYFELEKSDCSIWEFEGNPLETLDYVLQQEEEKQLANNQESTESFAPIEISDGCYRISLKEIQENNTTITSKQALLPFLRKGDFYELEVLCSHIPPWLEAEFINTNLIGKFEKISSDEIKVTINKKCCNSR